MGRESSVHSACSVLYCACFQSSDKTYTMVLPGLCRGDMNEATAPDIQGSGSSKEWNYKKCIYQSLVTRPGLQNFLWMLVARNNIYWRTHISFAIQYSYAWNTTDKKMFAHSKFLAYGAGVRPHFCTPELDAAIRCSKLVFTYFKCLYFSHSSILEFCGGHAIKQLSRESPDLSACPWLLRIQIWCLENFLSFYGLTNFMFKWIWCGSEGSCDDFFVRYLNKCWILLQNSIYSCVTTLSSCCELFSYGHMCSISLWPRYISMDIFQHFHGDDCRNSGHTIANLDLRVERHWHQIFLRLVDVTFHL